MLIKVKWETAFKIRSRGCDSEPRELESGSIGWKSEPVKYMNWDLSG